MSQWHPANQGYRPLDLILQYGYNISVRRSLDYQVRMVQLSFGVWQEFAHLDIMHLVDLGHWMAAHRVLEDAA